MKEESRLILALDETRKGKALEVAEEVADLVAAIKINWPLVLSSSPEIIDELSLLSDIICDFKVADIPNTNRLIVEQAVARGAKGVIVHGFTGSDSVRAAVEAAGDAEVFVVVEMSHPGGKEFTQGASERIARIAKESGAAGVIAPATRPNRIREIRSMVGDLKILSPGVGAQGGSAADAISMGADFVIVGRAIYQADSPRAVAEDICEESRRAWANRPD
ncbi:MAG TPA: orotidine-5'-phosphate decarboxylase [Methanomassiliicoccales archaeon]|nr:orotidine-5'-phosphate decarboxylase [Methanomassiliicoccales archaeon]